MVFVASLRPALERADYALQIASAAVDSAFQRVPFTHAIVLEAEECATTMGSAAAEPAPTMRARAVLRLPIVKRTLNAAADCVRRLDPLPEHVHVSPRPIAALGTAFMRILR
jgi:hypothetical protein